MYSSRWRMFSREMDTRTPSGKTHPLPVTRVEHWQHDTAHLWAHAFKHCFRDPESPLAWDAFTYAQRDLRPRPDQNRELLHAIEHITNDPNSMRQAMQPLFQYIATTPNVYRKYYTDILSKPAYTIISTVQLPTHTLPPPKMNAHGASEPYMGPL